MRIHRLAKIALVVLALTLAASLVTGCQTMAKTMSGMSAIPGHRVSEDVAEDVGCDYALIEAKTDSVLASMKGSDSKYSLPPEGATHCDVLAHLGLPSNMGSFQSGERATWVYRATYTSAYAPRGPTIFVHMILRDDTYYVEETSMAG